MHNPLRIQKSIAFFPLWPNVPLTLTVSTDAICTLPYTLPLPVTFLISWQKERQIVSPSGMLPSYSGIIAGAIHEQENILLFRGTEPGLPRWKVATTTTMLPDVVIS